MDPNASSFLFNPSKCWSSRQCASGLRLFHAGSEFSLYYKDRDDSWRTVGDVPWKEFVECVKRLRIARN